MQQQEMVQQMPSMTMTFSQLGLAAEGCVALGLPQVMVSLVVCPVMVSNTRSEQLMVLVQRLHHAMFSLTINTVGIAEQLPQRTSIYHMNRAFKAKRPALPLYVWNLCQKSISPAI
jgi:hypothetical protein